MPIPAPAPDLTAVVTGASSGIGAEIARELARRGYGVTLVARRADRLAELAAELPTRTEVVPCDVGDPAARAGLLAEVEGRGLRVGVLVNNAGLSTTGPLATSDPDALLTMLRVDVEAVADLTARAVPAMVARGSGGILNTASTAAFQPLPGQAGYGASKAFVLSFGQAVGAELRGSGVTVTTLCPGPVDTEFAAVAGFAAEEVEASLPRFMWVDAATVAKAAVDGLVRGRSVVIPGAANAIGARLGHLAPRRLMLPFMARTHPALKR